MVQSSPRIAVVGIGAIFPQSPGPEEFWQNIRAARSAARPVPPGRWLLANDDAFDPRKDIPDRVYSLHGCFIEGFHFDAGGLDVDPALLAELDPLFHLVLHAGRQAWHDAAMANIDRRRVGVVIGNIALPTEKASALARTVLGATVEEQALGVVPNVGPIDRFNRFAAGLPGSLLAKALGLGGGSFTLDAACASSLYAVKLAADELIAGRADAMLTGGLSRPDCLYTQMGFSQLHALSPSGRCSPFDAGADGLVVGEGAGIFVLKRLDDALAAGDRIYAVIAGIGLSNDVHGKLLAPSTEGQLRALRAAYARAGWQPGDVDLIECHGTGTPTGDAVELESLCELWRDVPRRTCVIGSVKSNVGHALTAAGAAGLLKVLLALREKTLLPTANFSRPAAGLAADGPFQVLGEARPWERRGKQTPRRAAVSAFGFGGINAHVLLEEWDAETSKRTSIPVTAPATRDVAIVGMGAHFGRWRGLKAVAERFLGSEADAEPAPPRHACGVEKTTWFKRCGASLHGYFIDDLPVSLDRFRIPPRELEEMLPQQLLMLQVAADALADAAGSATPATSPLFTTGVFIGIELDLNTTNFHLRWSMLNEARAWNEREQLGLSPAEVEAWARELRENVGAALNANRTMGALGGIVASRVAREFRIGGPSVTVSATEAGGLHALQTAVRLLQQGELDQALVGAVDLAGDIRALFSQSQHGVIHSSEPKPEGESSSPRGTIRDEIPSNHAAERPTAARAGVPGEGAAALVLKRLDDALRDGDHIHAIIRGMGTVSGGGIDHASNPPANAEARARACADARVAPASIEFVATNAEADIGHAGAAAGLAELLKACVCLDRELLPGPQYWLHDRASGPRRAGVSAVSMDGNCHHVVLEEAPAEARERMPAVRAVPGPRETLFAVEGDDVAGLRSELRRLGEAARQTPTIASLARTASRKPAARRGLALLARDGEELQRLIGTADAWLADHAEENPAASRDPALERIFYAPEWVGRPAKAAFVFPGSGNAFAGMGRTLSAAFPEVLRRQHAENERLRSQIVPELFWNRDDLAGVSDNRALIFGQVALGTLVSDVLQSLGIKPDAVLGYSLGETAGLFALRAWTDRDKMLRRMEASPLFSTELAGPCDAARRAWRLPVNEPVHWLAGVVDVPADAVRERLAGRERVYLLIVNTPREAIIGGDRAAVEALVRDLRCRFVLLSGVSTVHCPVVREVEAEYRALHLLPTTPPSGVDFYSGFWGRRHELSREQAAESILAQALHGIDFPRLIQQAYADGINVFIEIGPGSSCTRMIGQILESHPHVARPACVAGADEVGTILRLAGHLIAARVPVDIARLYEGAEAIGPAASARSILVPVGGKPFNIRRVERNHDEPPSPLSEPWDPTPAPAVPDSRPSPNGTRTVSTMQAQLTLTSAARADAHASYLRFSQNLVQAMAGQLSLQMTLADANPTIVDIAPLSPAPPRSDVFLDRPQCLEFAVGSIARVLGAEFADADTFPTRVRLPDEPLMLVDRILSVEGEPRSLTSGRVVTEHDVRPGSWYLDARRIPTCIAVEAGQADLFLSGYLGIDLRTRGLAVYRLLDAVVIFHRGLPEAGAVIHYDIRIERFFRQGDTHLFRFSFEGTVNGEPLLTMRDGCAGFFTAADLAAGRGVVQTELDRRPRPGIRPDDWRDLVPMAVESYSEAQIEALRRGDLAGCFGASFTALPLRRPAALPGGRMRLVHRVPHLDPRGGRFGLGQIRAEADIHPDDWFLTCHFVDDRVMPGTLMYECCLHTLRVLLMRMGWVGEEGEFACEPVPGVASRLRCRGQVVESTRVVTYEVTLKEIGYRPEPYAIADALMYADGKPIVEITDMSLRMTGLTRGKVEALWTGEPGASAPGGSHAEADYPQAPPGADAPGSPALFTREHILAFAVGNPSEAFGEPYRIFDRDRFIARLPGEPFCFIDRVLSCTATPFRMEAGGKVVMEYDVPPDAWYFAANQQAAMPYAVLLEAALQPCGWLAAYIGSPLTSPDDLHFRNLGGTATQFVPVLPDVGTLRMRARVTKVSQSAGMIIQNYDIAISAGGRPVYQGDTYFGYFTQAALAQQVGIRDANAHTPGAAEIERGRAFAFPARAGLPVPPFQMIDRIDLLIPDGGPAGLGFIQGSKDVDPTEWFFQAHFYKDPVWPGSLGLEAFIQLLKVFAAERWGATSFDSPASGAQHQWLYRGQVIPKDRRVTVTAWITAWDDANKHLRADGLLSVDGRVIYRMKDFSLACPRDSAVGK